MAKNQTLQTTHTSLEVVEYIKQEDGARLNQIAEELELARSTVHNHVTTLTENGYLVKEDNTYKIGLQFFHVGIHSRDRDPENQLAVENVRTLARKTNEEVTFGVGAFGRVITLYDTIGYEVEQNQNVGVFKIGKYYDMHCTGLGKALLAEHPTEEVTRIIERNGLAERTSTTITSEEELRAELDTIRDRGYAINDEEYVQGHRSVAAPVKKPDGSISGALSIQGPAYRLTVDRLVEMYQNKLLDSVRDLEEKLERVY